MWKLVLAIAVACSGCSPTYQPTAYSHVNGSGVEAMIRNAGDIDTLRQRIGMPLTGTMDLPNGRKLWTFGTTGSSAAAVPGQSFTTAYNQNLAQSYATSTSVQWVPIATSCTVQVEAKPDGKLTGGTWNGNACP